MLSLAQGQRALRSPLHRMHIIAPLTTPTHTFSTSAFRAAPSPQPSRQTSTPEPHSLNAPTSTLPAEINTPEPADPTAPTTAKLHRFISIGRAYLTFYKTGLKNVFWNYRASLPLRASLALPAYLPTSPPTAPNALSRGQYQLVRRSARDVRRMIPFTLILMLCGEFTPLIIPLFGSAITPATCRVPRQVAKDRAAHEKRKFAALRDHVRAEGSASVTDWKLGGREERALVRLADVRAVDGAGVLAVLRVCALFDLVKSHDRFLGSALVGLVYRPRLRRYLEYLAVDDGLIRAGGGVQALSAAEVRIACDERGACGGGDLVVARNGRSSVSGSRARGLRSAAAADELQRDRNEKLEREWLARWLELREDKGQ